HAAPPESALAAADGAASRRGAAPRPLTILHVAAPARVGGLERVVRSLCAGHPARGHRVHLLAVVDPGEADHPIVAPLAEAGVEVRVLEVAARGYLRERAVMRELCGSIRPDVVHTHGYRPDLVDGPVARSLGIATVATVHGFIRGSWKGRLYEWLQRWSFRRFDAVAAVSRPQVAELAAAGVPPERIHHLPNAWAAHAPTLPPAEARARLGVPEGVFHVGWVGRLGREKGADVLLDALALLRDLPLVASVVGAGREEASLRAQAEALGVADRVRWHGLVAEAGPLFSAFDAFVLSSRTEGTPIALFEAMEAGAPVVATAVGGVPDVLSAAEALLVPSEDPARLAEALRAVRDDPAAAAARARAAATRLRTEFGADPWLDRYEEIYRLVQRQTVA
ncbi:MAG TPA: glycosyltransferase, partial [Longimicrobiaceae bacterium]|nr:glycosyltransferase [Longimicrobiaceae bacterium]